jgi:hypothetical protein
MIFQNKTQNLTKFTHLKFSYLFNNEQYKTCDILNQLRVFLIKIFKIECIYTPRKPMLTNFDFLPRFRVGFELSFKNWIGQVYTIVVKNDATHQFCNGHHITICLNILVCIALLTHMLTLV